MKAKILISLKQGVLDPQAKAILHALHAKKFESVNSLKLSKEILLNISHNDKQKAMEESKQMCEELLANTVIEEYKIEIIEG